ncbi:response regulator [Rasiella rasia]|uniref:histidine kinase n=1 Tax=Rasiella rasia TaxID=2744027 RepID=A0A6G6GP03_9FLAO|nr:response regulator [Rasiella rasia]QIE60306.1 response regulator [Rasiella rasia]
MIIKQILTRSHLYFKIVKGLFLIGVLFLCTVNVAAQNSTTTQQYDASNFLTRHYNLDSLKKYHLTAKNFYNEGLLDSAYKYSIVSYELAKKLKKDSLQIAIASTLSFLERDLEKAIYYLEETEPIAINNPHWEYLEKLYHTKGVVYFNNTYDEQALVQFIKLDSLLAQKNTNVLLTAMNKVNIVNVLFKTTISTAKDTSYLQQMEKNIDAGLQVVEKGLKIHPDSIAFYNAVSLQEPAAILYEKKAFVYEQRNDIKKAISNYRKALENTVAGTNYLRKSSVYNGLAKLYNTQNTQDSAAYYYNQELKAINKTTDTLQQAITYYRIAEFYNQNNKSEIALLHLDKSKALLDKSYFVREELMFDYQDILSRVQYNLGNFKEAYLASIKAKEHLLQIEKQNNQKNISELETKYQTDTKDREIELLTSQKELAEQQKTNQRNLLLATVVLTTLAGLFFFFQYKNRQKTTKKLRELDKAKSTFFANISHEFRTPLTLIKGPLEDQLTTATTPAERKNLISAQQNTSRLQVLVDQLLALSKLESGHFKLQIKKGNIEKHLLALAETFRFACKEKNIHYTITIQPNNEPVYFDLDALEKIVINLLGNAVKYTPENETISLIGKQDHGNFIFYIENTGNPISEENQQHLFERFYQTNFQNTGTGIGLALTKELVTLHQGTIIVNSNENSTRFTVQIPVRKSNFNASQLVSESLQEPEIPISEVEIKEIIGVAQPISAPEDAPILLVVEDHADIAAYITSIFENEYKVITTSNGKEALDVAVSEIPDIIISDIMMPIIDGNELTKNIKEHELTSHIPVLLLTAKTEDTDKLTAAGVGADVYMTKPFNSRLLHSRVANLIENRTKVQARFSKEVILTPKEISVSSADEKFLEKLQLVLDDKLTDSEFTSAAFCEAVGISRMQLHRKLKALTGQSTTEFIKSQRLKMAVQLLKKNKLSISEIGYTVGFNDPSYFTKCFKEEYGKLPTQFVD